jgi:hypothetical protein
MPRWQPLALVLVLLCGAPSTQSAELSLREVVEMLVAGPGV